MATNLTPDHLRCSLGGCPSVHELEDGNFVIVGKYARLMADTEASALRDNLRNAGQIGPDEAAIFVEADLLSTLKSRWIKEALEAAGVGQG